MSSSRTPQTSVSNAEKGETVHVQVSTPKRTRLLGRVSWAVDDIVDNYAGELNFARCMYYLFAYTWAIFILFLTWKLLPIHGHWPEMRQWDSVPDQYHDLNSYFGPFQGNAECNIKATDLYQPLGQDVSHASHNAYCPRRKDLLEAMSSGGRIGFDAPYFPRDCHYRWYSVEEICMILERFDALVFIGDSGLRTIYNGLNILLRRDLAHGALKTWVMDKNTIRQCSCDNQFTSRTCSEHFLASSDEMARAPQEKVSSPYFCNRTPHAFLPVTSAPAPQSIVDKFNLLVPRTKRSNYHRTPVIHSLSPGTASVETAISSLEEILGLADASHRKTPLLFIGPTAAGHVEIRGRKGNQEIWAFDRHLRQVAEDNDAEVLGMWNLTVQAASWDGVRFAEKVAVTQAMMVVNWLARLPSS